MKLNNQITNIIAACLLLFVFFACLFSMKDDSATMDEAAHLPAGYSYLTQKDMRLNPEHPPLIKDLAAIPLLFIKNINFPSEIKAWKEDVNSQWDFGNNFLYNSGNPTDKMIFWSRLPMILILILLGFYIFKWAKELFGNKTALFALFLFSFSPTLLAHGRLVTTDVGAAAGIFIATYYFLKALRNPTSQNIIFSGISFGLALMLKFTTIILIPFFIFLILIWFLIKLGTLNKSLKVLVLSFLLGFFLILPIYQYHVWNYPQDRQTKDTEFILTSFNNRPIANLIIWMSQKPILKAYAQYNLGLAMSLQRATGGNTTYFLGEVSATGWKNYFPIVYAIKEPLSFHILTLIALLYAIWLIMKKPPHHPAPNLKAGGAGLVQHRALIWCWAFWQNTFDRFKDWMNPHTITRTDFVNFGAFGALSSFGVGVKEHFTEFAMLTFIIVYWLTSLTSNLNIGVRHLLPVFPFTILLVSAMIIYWLKSSPKKIKYAFCGILIAWQIFSVAKVYPHLLSYCNELAGGADKCYLYVVDSNYDWGQDLKHLTKWVNDNKINKIYVDYFGGGDTKYYLKEKYAPWWGTRNPMEFPRGNYLAVSATFLQGGRGKPAPGFDQPTGYYKWLDNYKPIAKIGYSIFVYHID